MKKKTAILSEALTLALALILGGCMGEIEVPDDLPGSIEERPTLVPNTPDSVDTDSVPAPPSMGVDRDQVFAVRNADGVVVYYRPLTAATCEVVPCDEGALGAMTYSGRVCIPERVMHDGRVMTVVSVAERAFERSEVTEVILPATLTQIGAYAFQYSTELRRLTIPGGLSRVEICLCRGCTSLTTVEMCDGISYVGKLAFTKCTALTEVQLPYSLGVIDVGAFQGCVALQQIYVPRYVSTINDYAFSRCGLTSFAFPDKVQQLAEGVLSNCLGLSSVALPSSLVEVGSYALAGCVELGEVELPRSVSRIGSHAFWSCPSLCRLRALPLVPPSCCDDTFDAAASDDIDIRLEVPEGSEGAYRAAPIWQRFDLISTLSADLP